MLVQCVKLILLCFPVRTVVYLIVAKCTFRLFFFLLYSSTVPHRYRTIAVSLKPLFFLENFFLRTVLYLTYVRWFYLWKKINSLMIIFRYDIRAFVRKSDSSYLVSLVLYKNIRGHIRYRY